MKINAPGWLMGAAVALFVVGLGARAEEAIVASLFVAGSSVFTYIAVLRARLAEKETPTNVEMRLQELERRLGLTEGELDVANEQLQRLRAEREFDRALEAGRGVMPG